mmetsp:Transcript_26417/g.41873  ORF Transcript_26417/g.41873 Transcript_26417/m.41873 type:complete len:85 (-) Transcript_26417:396-650(-)
MSRPELLDFSDSVNILGERAGAPLGKPKCNAVHISEFPTRMMELTWAWTESARLATASRRDLLQSQAREASVSQKQLNARGNTC